MVPLALHKRLWTWCCVYPADESTSRWAKMALTIFTLFIFLGNLSVIPVSVEFVIENVTIDSEGSLHGLFQVTAYAGMVYANIIGFTLRYKVTAIFDKLTEIYSISAHMDSFHYLEKANKKCEWMWRFYFKCMIFAFINTSITTTQSLVNCQSKYDNFNTTCLYHPYKVIMPWNCETPFGYFWEMVFSFTTGQTYIFTNGLIILLFIAMCLHHQAFSDMFGHSLHKLDFEDEIQNDRKLIRELIEFHSMAKSWMMESVEAYSAIILVQLVCLTICIACIIFELDLQLQNTGSDVSILLAGFFFCASTPFMYCFFGEKATDSYSKMTDNLFESNWLRLPLDLQKYLILMIANMQRPLYYHGFGIIVLNLETFRKIFRTIITYYMMFKTLTA